MAGAARGRTGAALALGAPRPPESAAIFFIQHLTPLADAGAATPASTPTACWARSASTSPWTRRRKAAETYARVLGMPVPRVQRAT